MEATQFLARRLHPVKVSIDLLNHELELAKSEREVTLRKEQLESIISTLELFIEDYEAKYGKGISQPVAERKFVDSSKTKV